jgi:hypothetical protein
MRLYMCSLVCGRVFLYGWVVSVFMKVTGLKLFDNTSVQGERGIEQIHFFKLSFLILCPIQDFRKGWGCACVCVCLCVGGWVGVGGGWGLFCNSFRWAEMACWAWQGNAARGAERGAAHY